MKNFIILIITFLFLVSCGTTSTLSSPYYNISILNSSGKVVYHFPCVKIISQDRGEDYEAITFRALDGKYYSIKGKDIVIQETTYRTYRRSYYYYDLGPSFRYYPRYHYYHNPGPRPIPRPHHSKPMPHNRSRR